MQVEMSPSVYLALCALVKDAMEVESDAAPLLGKAALELANAARHIADMPEEVEMHANAIREMAESVLAKKSAA